MFTNWLTGSSNNSSSGNFNGNGSRLASNNAATTCHTTTAMSVLGGSSLGGVMSTPPDVILEVGPTPTSVRFVAHALVLGMHSGYLRSAIRMDEASTAAATVVTTGSNASGLSGSGAPTVAVGTAATEGQLLLYLGNVTAEQFAPLLTYMYTGYLDLNVDNIFAVLLATHVLHMPRALEICRSYLARAQTEGYLSGNPSNHQLQLPSPAPIAGKIIRPIASKATLPNFGFMPAVPTATVVAAPVAGAVVGAGYGPANVQQQQQLLLMEPQSMAQRQQHLSVDREDDEDEEEDVEVFIDSNTVTDNELDTEDCNVSVVSSLASSSAASSLNIERIEPKHTAPATTTPISAPLPSSTPTPTPMPEAATATPAVVATPPKPAKAAPTQQSRRHGNNTSNCKRTNNKRRVPSSGSNNNNHNNNNNSSSSGLQVAKAPVPAMQLETVTATTTAGTAAKFIIDVASCDGPVRFRRILNTAYGHKPDIFEASNVGELQRTQQSVSYSFHQQMARAISSQQRQQQHEENENNSATEAATTAVRAMRGAAAATVTSAATAIAAATHRKQASAELFVCVYCKHTFKSQYCYQKHAKRHLNPLSLDKKLTEAQVTVARDATESNTNTELLTATAATTTVTAAVIAAAAVNGGIAGGGGGGGGATAAAATASNGDNGDGSTLTTAALLRREVRPLDMNVQYYPCKTCGSKFPSYYFVHKHRKLCHADELEATSNSNNGTNNITKREPATATTTTTATATTAATVTP